MKKYQFSIKSEEELKDLSHDELMEYTKNLTQEWHKLQKPKKNSTNSSIPTGKEIESPKRNKSLRKGGGKNGGQVGHKGTTLKQSDTPDEIIAIEKIRGQVLIINRRNFMLYLQH